MYKIITQIVQGSNNDWNERLLEALWAYRTAYKVTTKHTPFQLVYGQEAILPIELEVPSLRIAIDERLGDENYLKYRYAILENLDELHAQAYLNMAAIQPHQKTYYDSKVHPKTLNPNNLVLLNTIFIKIRQNAHFETTTTCKTSKIIVEAKKKHVLQHEHREIQHTRLV